MIALALPALAMSMTSLLAASLVLVVVAASDRRPTAPLVEAFAAASSLR